MLNITTERHAISSHTSILHSVSVRSQQASRIREVLSCTKGSVLAMNRDV